MAKPHLITLNGAQWQLNTEPQDGQLVITCTPHGNGQKPQFAWKVYVKDAEATTAAGDLVSLYFYYTVQLVNGAWLWRRYVPNHEYAPLIEKADLPYEVCPLGDYLDIGKEFDKIVDWYEN